MGEVLKRQTFKEREREKKKIQFHCIGKVVTGKVVKLTNVLMSRALFSEDLVFCNIQAQLCDA